MSVRAPVRRLVGNCPEACAVAAQRGASSPPPGGGGGGKAHPKPDAGSAGVGGGEEVLDADDAGARVQGDAVEAARERGDGAEPEALPARKGGGGGTELGCGRIGAGAALGGAGAGGDAPHAHAGWDTSARRKIWCSASTLPRILKS